MGNSCECLGGGGGYPMGGPKNQGQDGAGYDLEDSGRAPGGSYRKTAAKYAVPESGSSTDLNKNKSEPVVIDTETGDPDLKLELQTPVATDEEVGVFFTEGAQKEDMDNQHAVSREVSPKAKTTETHVAKFTAPSPKNNGDVPRGETPLAVVAETAKTHVEVFDLSIPAETASARADSTAINSNEHAVVHINMNDYLTEQSSPSETSVHSGSTKSKSPTASPKSGIENVTYLHSEGISTPARISVPDNISPKSIEASHQSDSPGSGVANEGFDISDEQEVSPPPARLAGGPVDAGLVELPDDKYFFFGMESLKFHTRVPGDHDLSEADREVAEIMSVLDIIEDTIWLTMKPPVDDVDAAGTGDGLATREDREQIYANVLYHLKDACSKVEDILRKKGVHTSEFDDSWLNLPSMTSINTRYNKETASAQTDTARRLIRASTGNDQEKAREILVEYKRQQERLLRMREAERLKLKNKLGAKLSSRNENDRALSKDRDGDSDTEQIQNNYGKIMTAEGAPNDSLMSSPTPSDIEEYTSDDVSSSSDDTAIFTEADLEATHTLRTTLTNDIQDRMADMTSNDFQSIMSMYRKERHNIREIRDSERGKLALSLWDKLAERRSHVDKSIHEDFQSTVPKAVDVETATASVTTKDAHTSGGPAEVQSTVTETNCTGSPQHVAVGVTSEDLDQLNQEVLSRTFHKSGADQVSREDAHNVLQEHFSRVKMLRDQREAAARQHRVNALEQMNARRGAKTDGVEYGERTLDDEIKEAEIHKEEESIQEDCYNKLKSHEAVSQDELASILGNYQENQKSLIEKRDRQMAAHNRRLQEKLAASKESTRPRSARKENLQSMDEAFYHSLVARRQEGDLAPAQLSRLIEEHLDLVDEFKKEVRQQINQRRRERRDQADPAKVSALVEEDRQNREQVRRLRQQEKDRMDGRLGELLKQRKQMKEEENVPPKKPQRKSKSSVREDPEN